MLSYAFQSRNFHKKHIKKFQYLSIFHLEKQFNLYKNNPKNTNISHKTYKKVPIENLFLNAFKN